LGKRRLQLLLARHDMHVYGGTDATGPYICVGGRPWPCFWELAALSPKGTPQPLLCCESSACYDHPTHQLLQHTHITTRCSSASMMEAPDTCSSLLTMVFAVAVPVLCDCALEPGLLSWPEHLHTAAHQSSTRLLCTCCCCCCCWGALAAACPFAAACTFAAACNTRLASSRLWCSCCAGAGASWWLACRCSFCGIADCAGWLGGGEGPAWV
jgi:hypothetical protein